MERISIDRLPDFSDEIASMVRERRSWAYQAGLFDTPQFLSPSPSDSDAHQAIPVSFREIVSEIQDTSYLTHGIFYYPAKFIPHVPYYCVRHFCSEGEWVIDPFAGSGTVGLEAVLARRNAILIDINPLLKHIAELKINFRRVDVDEATLFKRIQAMLGSTDEFEPAWSNLDYWYPPEILAVLKRYWGWFHKNSSDVYAQIIACSLLRASRRFSWAEHKAPKLFRSRMKLRDIEQLLQTDWQAALNGFIWERAVDVLRRVRSLAHLTHRHSCRAIAIAGADSASVDLTDLPEVGLLVTSPPYMQAQEYIRTFKLDLFWLGYSEETVKRIAQLEIPYRKAPQQFHSPTYSQIYGQVERADLRDLMNAYFYYTTRALQNAATKLKVGGFMCVFVGNPKMDGIEIPTWRIIAEHFEKLGFQMYGVYEDAIKNRQLFRGRRNKNPEGMPSEFLLVMRREG